MDTEIDSRYGKWFKPPIKAFSHKKIMRLSPALNVGSRSVWPKKCIRYITSNNFIDNFPELIPTTITFYS